MNSTTSNNTSRTGTAFNRRLLIAFLIERGINTVALLIDATGYPKRTVVDSIGTMTDYNIVIGRVGTTRTGHYKVESWGQVTLDKVNLDIDEIKARANCERSISTMLGSKK